MSFVFAFESVCEAYKALNPTAMLATRAPSLCLPAPPRLPAPLEPLTSSLSFAVRARAFSVTAMTASLARMHGRTSEQEEDTSSLNTGYLFCFILRWIGKSQA